MSLIKKRQEAMDNAILYYSKIDSEYVIGKLYLKSDLKKAGQWFARLKSSHIPSNFYLSFINIDLQFQQLSSNYLKNDILSTDFIRNLYIIALKKPSPKLNKNQINDKNEEEEDDEKDINWFILNANRLCAQIANEPLQFYINAFKLGDSDALKCLLYKSYYCHSTSYFDEKRIAQIVLDKMLQIGKENGDPYAIAQYYKNIIISQSIKKLNMDNSISEAANFLKDNYYLYIVGKEAAISDLITESISNKDDFVSKLTSFSQSGDQFPEVVAITGYAYYCLHIKKDYQSAYNLYKKAERLNSIEANNALGYMHYYGYYAPQDIKIANQYFLKCLQSSYIPAIHNLNFTYKNLNDLNIAKQIDPFINIMTNNYIQK